MSKPSILLVVPAATEAEFADYVREYVAPIHHSEVRILTDAEASSFETDVPEKVARTLFDSILAHGVDSDRLLLVHREAHCSSRTLSKLWTSEGYATKNIKVISPKRIHKELKRHWETAGIFWRTHAEGQIAGYDFQKSRLDAWLQQFGELGFPTTGRRLAAQLRVIRLNQLTAAPFGPQPSEQIGQSQAFCYVQDNDQGGSWAEIQSILSHVHSPSSVHSVRWNKATSQIIFPDVDVDEYVICEDGLWSGSETVRRLRAIRALEVDKLIRLKFGVVSDFGLLVARFAIKELGLFGRVTVDAASSELVRFLRDDIPGEVRRGHGMSIDEYFSALHDWVTPQAFCMHPVCEVDLDACREIGRQLVSDWLTKKNGAPPREEDVRRFALGGGGFASTTVFARSIPKVCMPIFWLNGTVTIGSRSVEWEPLFVDARRVVDKQI